MSPHPETPSHLSPLPSLWVVPVHQPQASSIMHRTWTGDLFHIRYYTCFNAILPNHPTLSLSKVRSVHLCLFCCLAYRVIVTIFLNSMKVKVKSLSRVQLFATCGLSPTKLLRPWDCPGKNTGVGCHFLLQGIFLTQGSNPGLSHFRETL